MLADRVGWRQVSCTVWNTTVIEDQAVVAKYFSHTSSTSWILAVVGHRSISPCNINISVKYHSFYVVMSGLLAWEDTLVCCDWKPQHVNSHQQQIQHRVCQDKHIHIHCSESTLMMMIVFKHCLNLLMLVEVISWLFPVFPSHFLWRCGHTSEKCLIVFFLLLLWAYSSSAPTDITERTTVTCGLTFHRRQ